MTKFCISCAYCIIPQLKCSFHPHDYGDYCVTGAYSYESCSTMRQAGRENEFLACGPEASFFKKASVIKGVKDILKTLFLRNGVDIEIKIDKREPTVCQDSSCSDKKKWGDSKKSKYPLAGMSVGEKVCCDPLDYIGKRGKGASHTLYTRIQWSVRKFHRFSEKRFTVRKRADGMVTVTRNA